jgi:hypothetical protein
MLLSNHLAPTSYNIERLIGIYLWVYRIIIASLHLNLNLLQ